MRNFLISQTLVNYLKMLTDIKIYCTREGETLLPRFHLITNTLIFYPTDRNIRLHSNELYFNSMDTFIINHIPHII